MRISIFYSVIGFLSAWGHGPTAGGDLAEEQHLDPIIRRKDVSKANLSTGSYRPCSIWHRLQQGKICVLSATDMSQSMRELDKRAERHWWWIKTEGSVITPNDGRHPRPIDVLSPTWFEDIELTRLGTVIQRSSVSTTHEEHCNYLRAPFRLSDIFFNEDDQTLCRLVYTVTFTELIQVNGVNGSSE